MVAYAGWRTSSFSGSNGGNCVEVAWAGRSLGGGDCVEVAATLGALRDSKNPGPVLTGRVDLLVASIKKLHPGAFVDV